MIRASLPLAGLVLLVALAACEDPLDPDAITEHGMTLRAQRYIDDALAIVSGNWMFRRRIDWDSVRTATYAEAEGADLMADTWAALDAMLRGLGDGHSRLDTSTSRPGSVAAPADAAQSGPRIVAGKLAFYPVAPSNLGGALGDAWASAIARQVTELQASSPCGWIVDVRTNSGGNMWTMLAGLGGLIGEGRIGGFVDPGDPGDSFEWRYEAGRSWYGGQPLAHATDAPVFDPLPPVAVLTGEDTFSAGEAVAVAFRGRPDSRSFGTATGGGSNGFRTYTLYDGATLILAELAFADREGRLFGEEIPPDEVVEGGLTRELDTDAVMARAAEWLLASSACASPGGSPPE